MVKCFWWSTPSLASGKNDLMDETCKHRTADLIRSLITCSKSSYIQCGRLIFLFLSFLLTRNGIYRSFFLPRSHISSNETFQAAEASFILQNGAELKIEIQLNGLAPA